jgi:long-chain acyl-CoA synthetase
VQVHLSSEEFSVDNDLITPSFKLKRPQLKKRFEKQIQSMYKALGQ